MQFEQYIKFCERREKFEDDATLGHPSSLPTENTVGSVIFCEELCVIFLMLLDVMQQHHPPLQIC
jgi:hypothetical protein